MGQFGIGQSVRRTEDDRFIVGEGLYTDDFHLDGEVYAAFVRSPFPHALVKSIDIDDARALDGVLDIITAADLQEAGVGPLPCIAPPITNKDGTDSPRPPRFTLATDKVRYVGEPVACVIATSMNAARDAAEQVFVDYEDLPCVVDTEGALADGAPVIYDSNPGNLAFDYFYGDEDKTNANFDKAAHVTKLRLINNRLAVVPMEPRALIAEPHDDGEKLTLHTATQGSQMWQFLVSQLVLQMPAENMRVVANDVGGSFGMKAFLYPEQITLAIAAKRVGKPVRWTSDRSEAFLTDNQGRDNVSYAELALDADGKFLGVRVNTLAAMGGALSAFAPNVPSVGPEGLQVGVYDVPAMSVRVKGVFTNTTPVDAYRGAGRPEAAYLIERLVDQAAHELKVSPAELRRKNFVHASQMPYTGVAGFTMDSGDFDKGLEKTLGASDWEGYGARVEASKAQGKIRGRGLCYYMEKTGGAPQEVGRVHITPDEKVILTLGNKGSGQGHATTFGQVVADKLGVPFENIELRAGDTGEMEGGGFTGGSSGAYMAGGAVTVASADLVEKGKELAAKELGVDADELSFDADQSIFEVPGTNQRLPLMSVAKLAGDGQGLIGNGVYEGKGPTFPNGGHVCEVEVDPETGVVKIDRYTIVDDFGVVINPMIVNGQVHGGVAQGIGQAAGEWVQYDTDSGQTLTGSLQDYWLPRADDMPHIHIEHFTVPSTNNELGVKGCGEAGATAAPPAFVCAVLDAVRPLGVEHLDMPITPSRLWQALQDAGS